MKFAECEEWLWRHINAGSPVHSVEFTDVEDVQLPSRLPRNSVAWPVGWIEDEKRYWRAMMDMEGSPLMPADEMEGPGYWVMGRWMKRYLEGRARQRKRAYKKQILRWLVGLDQ
jgi:hypothetical protein